MGNFTGYRCSLCGSEYFPEQVTYTCPKDGGNLDVVLDYANIGKYCSTEQIITSREPSLWRYLPLLPVDDPGGEGTPLRAAGYTPLYTPPALVRKLGVEHLWIKDEGRNPTASFKDRASSVVVARARQIGAEVVVTASTGNAGAALAGMAAAVGQKAVIFAPKTAPPAKVAQLLVFILPALVVGTTYLSQKLMATPSADPSQASMTRQMNIIMPMMFGLFALQFASGLSIYFIVSNLVGAAQSWLMNRRWQQKPILAPATAAVATSKASKPITAPADKAVVSSKASKPLKSPAGGDGKKKD